jgi:hypothetical protein
MKLRLQLLFLIALFGALTLLAGCSTPDVQDARSSALERRQDRMDSRTYARQNRWQERGEREDARARARLESW